MGIYEKYQTDGRLENEGIKTLFDDAVFYIARASKNNQKWAKKWAKVALDRKTFTKTLSVEELDNLTKDIYSEAVIVGWENVKDENGKDLPYNKANVRKILDDLPDLYNEIAAIAQNADNYNKKAIEEITKN